MVVSVVGVGTAWLVTAYDFPGRRHARGGAGAASRHPALHRRLHLCGARGAAGTASRSAFRALTGYRSRAEYWFPDLRSLPGAVFVLGVVLYPYVYMTVPGALRGAERDAARCGAHARRAPLRDLPHRRAAPRPPAAGARPVARAAGDAERRRRHRYLGVRTLTVSIYTTWINRGSLEGAAQIAASCWRWWRSSCCWSGGPGAAAASPPREAPAGRRPRRLLGPPPGWPSPPACAGRCSASCCPSASSPRSRDPDAALRASRMTSPPSSRPPSCSPASPPSLVVRLGGLVAPRCGWSGAGRRALLARLASLGYAVPGTVLAVGLLWPLAAIDNAIADAGAR